MDFQVGPWLVRPAMSSVVRGDTVRHITPKAMDVLACLARHKGQVVSKETMFREVWNGSIVTDDALTRCIKELRSALEDDFRNPSVIETIPKRGYRMVAPVTPSSDGTDAKAQPPPSAPGEMPARRRAWLAGAVCGAALVAAGLVTFRVQSGSPAMLRSIAVLPLQDLSVDPGQTYFAEGMTEALIAELARVRSLRVISRRSAMQYKNAGMTVPEIGRKLAVDAVIEGAVQRSDGRVRITVQLIHASSDSHVWSGAFERDIGDVLAVQSEIARSVVRELNLRLTPGEQHRIAADRRVQPDAYDAYLKGWHHFSRSRYGEAAAFFDEAARKDPHYALAHAMLYEADSMIAFAREAPVPERALKALALAGELDNGLAEVHTGLGDLEFWWKWNWDAGEREYRKAVEIDPASTDAAHHLAMCLHALRRWDEAEREYRRALETDPVSPRINNGLLALYIDSRRYREALLHLQSCLRLNPEYVPHRTHAGYLYEKLGRDAEAVAAYRKADMLSDRKSPSATAAGTASDYWRSRLAETSKAAGPPTLGLAVLNMRAGNPEEALRILDQCYRKRSPPLVWIAARADWDALRSDSRFQSILRGMNLH